MNEIRDIHLPFIAWLDKNSIPFHRNRPDKKTTAIKGDPDFLCTLANRCIYIECKVPGKKLSEDQEKRVMYLRQAGNTVKIAYSVEDCIYAVETWLGVVNATGGVPEPAKGQRARLSEAADKARERVSKLPKRERDRLMRDAFEKVRSGPASGSAYEIPVIPKKNLFIGTIGGKDYVLKGDSGPGGEARIQRLATAVDLINLRRR